MIRTVTTCWSEARNQLLKQPLFQKWQPDDAFHQCHHEAAELLAAASGWKVEELWRHLSDPIEEKVWLQMQSFLERRLQGEPLAYILGHAYFAGRKFVVDERCLIPRPDTESLLEISLAFLQESGRHTGCLLDLGTGSGALAVSVALEYPAWQVWAVDISPEALEVARQNQMLHQAAVRFIRADGLRLLAKINKRNRKKPHIILSNPPYIAESDPYRRVDEEVVRFEPHLALFAGKDGLDFYRELARLGPGILADEEAVGLFLEVGMGQAKQVQQLFSTKPWHSFATQLHCDLRGVHRVVAVIRHHRS